MCFVEPKGRDELDAGTGALPAFRLFSPLCVCVHRLSFHLKTSFSGCSRLPGGAPPPRQLLSSWVFVVFCVSQYLSNAKFWGEGLVLTCLGLGAHPGPQSGSGVRYPNTRPWDCADWRHMGISPKRAVHSDGHSCASNPHRA